MAPEKQATRPLNDNSGGYRDAPYNVWTTTWNVEVGAVAIDATGNGQIISFISFTFDQKTRALGPIGTSGAPGSSWTAAEKQWQSLRTSGKLRIYSH